MSVCFFRYDISKIYAARITKHDTQMFRYESWKPIYFGVKKSRSRVAKTLPTCVSLHSCECWPVASHYIQWELVGAWIQHVLLELLHPTCRLLGKQKVENSLLCSQKNRLYEPNKTQEGSIACYRLLPHSRRLLSHKVNGQYWWDLLLPQQMLTIIINVVVDNIIRLSATQLMHEPAHGARNTVQ